MAVTFELPSDIENTLRHQLADLDHAAKEALLVEMYRQRKLTHHQLSQALSLSRFETDGVLKRHEVYLEMTLDEVVQDSEGLSKLRKENAGRR